ncbi:E3 ubiquitin-protein ligase ATL23-like [Pyrus ussuriensis x Pyrus communis]|uniref:E3 ubiquitin-protein ligase ATL23-like n=1 Tax=Pyrus ussuriensis x Pyrus communis TaxID=2448454 RepID=A0A5N5HY44_9ROSA|nr:E3 ubiquitin-protein ligase ATL23-like [Pyrus x bretschneideri]KAB2628284.1 E3 ubiquitin-protein ligase ATL23-like [Pyrus ussuriensis x Pyrus communis]
MLLSVFLTMFLPCVGISAVFIVYVCLLWYATNDPAGDIGLPVKQVSEKGLSASELDKLPKITGKEVMAERRECAVCLDDIDGEQPARVVPGCNHAFHLLCADTWLSKHSFCPVCRAKIHPVDQSLDVSENPC